MRSSDPRVVGDRSTLGRWLSIIQILLLVVLVSAIALGVAVLWHLRATNTRWGPETVTDLNRYQVEVANWRSTGLVGHFPVSFPAAATDIRFHSFPGFLQGGASLQLHLRLASDEASAVLKQFRQKAVQDVEALEKKFPDDTPLPTFHTSPTGDTFGFPEGFEFLLLHAEDLGKNSFSWNHGRTAGVAVNRESGQVVYWAENW